MTKQITSISIKSIKCATA